MLYAFRAIGVFLAFFAFLNLIGLFFIDMTDLISPVAVLVRYSLMAIAGVGFLLLRKWGVIVYLGSFTVNWITFFTAYESHDSVGPLWLSIPIPLAIIILSYLSWGRLK